MTISFLMSLKNYLFHIKDTGWNLGFPLLMLAFFLLIAWIWIATHKKQSCTNDEKVVTTTGNILNAFFISGLITLTLALFVVIALLKFTAFFGNTFCQFGVVIGFLLICGLTLWSYTSICLHVKHRTIALLNTPIANTFMTQRFKVMKKHVRMYMLLFLFTIVPFGLLLIQSNRASLVSIVLDNSGSMNQYLDYGAFSLSNVLEESPHKGEYVFTTLDIRPSYSPKDSTIQQYFETIVNTTDPNRLPTSTATYANPQGLINDFLQVSTAGSTPLLQGIWQNYLTARNNFAHYKNRKMIVVSDGADDIYALEELLKQRWQHQDIFQQQGKVGESPVEFFNGGIYAINLGGDESAYLWEDCYESISLRDGNSQQSYFEALIDILPEMFFDWMLIFFIMGLLGITFFFGIVIPYLTLK